MITVDDAAENTIIVVAGANGALDAEDIKRLDDALDDARVLLLQLEVPMTTVVAAAQTAQTRRVTVIVDPAPAQTLPPELYAATDILTPNEHEASLLVGFGLVDPEAIERAGRVLIERGARNVVIKLGGKGAYWTNGTEARYLPPFKVEPVDTVAAGDAFNGGLAAALDSALDMADALQWAMATAALSVTKAGAQPSLPRRAEVLRLLTGA
jgi:ribokinase